MSRIYFVSEDGEAEVRGWERAHMGVLVSDLSWAMLGSTGRELPRLVPVDHYLHVIKSEYVVEAAHTWWSVTDEYPITVGDRTDDLGTIKLNTVASLGSPALQFIAWCHGQCEIHGWVGKDDRGWLAAVIDSGLKIGLLRDGAGWDQVTDLLRASRKGPVVTSYSVTEGFPGLHLEMAGQDVDDWDDAYDKWYDLSADERWRRSLDALITNKTGEFGSMWREDTWARGFGQGLTAQDVATYLVEERDTATVKGR